MDVPASIKNHPRFIDLTDQKFGQLTVIEFAGYSSYKLTQWLCQCDCGSLPIAIVGASLRRNLTKSCGCLKGEKREKILIHCKMCGKEKWTRTSKQGIPKYCSYACMHADKESKQRQAAIAAIQKRTPEGRAKARAGTLLRYQDPEERRKHGEKSRAAQGGRWEWKETPCFCNCGGIVRYKVLIPGENNKISGGHREYIRRFILGHNTKTETFREWQSERVKKEMDNDERAAQKRMDLLKGMEKQLVPYYFSRPMQIVAKMLTEMSIEFEKEWEAGRWSCDFYLPAIHGVIEVQGDYWHCNSRIYPDGPINKSQSNRQRADASKASYLENRGVRLLAIWEYDLKHTPSECHNRIEQFIHDESLSP